MWECVCEWGLVVLLDVVCGGCSLVVRKFSPYYLIEFFVMGDIPQSNLKREFWFVFKPVERMLSCTLLTFDPCILLIASCPCHITFGLEQNAVVDSQHTGSGFLGPDDTIWKFRGVSSPYGESGSLWSKRWDKPEQITPHAFFSFTDWCIVSSFPVHPACEENRPDEWHAALLRLVQSRSRRNNVSCCFASSLTSPHPHFLGLGCSKQSVSALILSQGQDIGAWFKPNSKPAPGPF